VASFRDSAVPARRKEVTGILFSVRVLATSANSGMAWMEGCTHGLQKWMRKAGESAAISLRDVLTFPFFWFS
jgi:hypothetical protein